MAPTPVAPTIPPKRALPPKEAALFKELLTLYETRQLKKGQKTADQILKKFPEHGETLCMKGLVLTHLGKRDEGIELVKKGIRLDLTSHICWHVFGLIQKAEKNYEEALKSYTQALRFDKENLNILRDAAQLQTHLRIYDGLVETRHTLLRLRPALRQHWIALVVAYHLNGNLKDAKKVLEHYERILKNVPDYDVEHSETLLYHIRILEELGENSEALLLLDINAKSRAIVDRTAIMEIRARLLSKLKSDEAHHAWRALIEQNPDSYDYYRGFLSNQNIDLDAITDENRQQALTFLREFSSQIPRARAPRWLALAIATGDEFRELAKTYLISALSKGIPSLFADIKPLYKDTQKLQIVEGIVEEYKKSLVADAPSSSEEPTTYLWTLYFLAQHYSTSGQLEHALSILAEALDHTPTLPELFTCKARVLKRAGDILGASRCLDEARLLDGQDRFLNTKCAKYRLRAGLVDEANEILGLFTKRDAPSPGADLEDMQSMLYLLEEGNAHHRSGKLNLALKKFIAIQKIFDEFDDDQYDFHGYSIRKFTINIYLNLVKWEGRLRSHPAYVAAALSASQIYLAAFDDPSVIKASSGGNLTDDEKKAQKKAKRAAQKAQEDVKKAMTPNVSGNEDKGLEPSPNKDDDPDGLKLLSATDPLERAAKLLKPLATLASDKVEVWIAIFDVAVRRKKYLQALKALEHARALDPEHPELHIRLVEFKRTVSTLPQPLSDPHGAILSESLNNLLPEEISLDTYNSQYLQRNPSSAPSILATAKVSYKLESPRESVESTIFNTLEENVNLDIKTALSIIAFLNIIKSPRTDDFRAKCDSKFPLSTVFKTPSEIASLQNSGSSSQSAIDVDKLEDIA
jgi:tetratricopeptide (TPR) repeat protein